MLYIMDKYACEKYAQFLAEKKNKQKELMKRSN